MEAKQQLLFVQGAGEGTYDEWDGKLVDSLRRKLGERCEILYPRMPDEDDPQYEAWRATLEEAIRTLRDGAVLVGHSVGGTILLQALAEGLADRALGGIFLVAAPFFGEGGWSADDLRFPDDLGARLPEGVPIHLFHGVEDEIVPPSHAELFGRAAPQAHIHRLPGRDHQLNDDMSEVAAAILALWTQR